METRLNQLCADIDRTASMGLFPHDAAAEPLSVASDDDLVRSIDSTGSAADRDQALWQLVYQQTKDTRTSVLPELLMTVATESSEAVLRRSASWALLKLGEASLLEQCLRSDDDGNVHSWKQHLIYEAQGRTDWVDPRPVRAIDSSLGYAVTLPLTIHGMVQFRVPDRRGIARSSVNNDVGRTNYDAWSARSTREDSYPSAWAPAQPAGQELPYGGSHSPSPNAYSWRSLVAGPINQARMVGNLTAGVGRGSFYDNLTIQKVCTDPMMDGFDHVQGYLFRGMSRSLGRNVMAHYYTSNGLQPYYLSGHISDTSEGVIDVETQLTRHAETNIVAKQGAPYPFVQSVRGLFFGPARLNPAAADPDGSIDNMLQIIRDPYANGWFFGEFRSVPVDVDGDGQVELNGIEMYTTLTGQVVDRSPMGPQRSNEFAR